MKFIALKFAFVFLFLSSFAFGQVDRALWNEYKKGLDNAYKFADLKQNKSLFNIDSTNSLIQVACRPDWGCQGGTKSWEQAGVFKPKVRVKVISVVSNSTSKLFAPYVKKQMVFNTQKKYLWVTAFPEIKMFCQKIKDKSKVQLELNKYLGLPPDSKKAMVVTMWAEPVDLFRPCLSPAISTPSCPVDAPKDVEPSHLKWLNNKFVESYPKVGDSFPFTKRGFAYYWGNPKSYIGASEYVVKLDSHLYIEGVEGIETYCR